MRAEKSISSQEYDDEILKYCTGTSNFFNSISLFCIVVPFLSTYQLKIFISRKLLEWVSVPRQCLHFTHLNESYNMMYTYCSRKRIQLGASPAENRRFCQKIVGKVAYRKTIKNTTNRNRCHHHYILHIRKV